MKSNEQRPIYEPCRITYLNPCLPTWIIVANSSMSHGFFPAWVFFFLYHHLPFDRHEDITRAITVESSLLHIARSRTRTVNLWFLSKSGMSHVAGFLGSWVPGFLASDKRLSANNLNLCWRTISFTYILAKVLKSWKMPLSFLIYNRCLCEFTHSLTKIL